MAISKKNTCLKEKAQPPILRLVESTPPLVSPNEEKAPKVKKVDRDEFFRNVPGRPDSPGTIFSNNFEKGIVLSARISELGSYTASFIGDHDCESREIPPELLSSHRGIASMIHQVHIGLRLAVPYLLTGSMESTYFYVRGKTEVYVLALSYFEPGNYWYGSVMRRPIENCERVFEFGAPHHQLLRVVCEDNR